MTTHPRHTRRTTRRNRIAAIAVPAAGLLFLGACGNDDAGPAETTLTTVDGDPTTTTAGDPTTNGDVVDDITDAGEQAQADLEQALRDAGLDNLASAVAQVDLSGVLADNEFTVFAPNDSAFLAVDSSDLASLLSDPAQILDLLQNHLVVGERIEADDLADLTTVTTEAGTSLTIATVGGSTTVDGATVVNTETAGDGVIHVIDQVLLPGDMS